MTDTSLVFNLLAKDRASRTIGSVGRRFDTLAAGITTAAVGVAAGLVAVGGQFDAASDTIRAGTGATGAALQALEQVNRDVMVNTGANIEATAQAVSDFNTMTGQTGEGLTGLATNFLNLQRITDQQGGTIEGLSRVFGDWSIATDKQTEAMDFLFKVSQETGIGMDQLESSVVQFGAPLRNLGFTFEESAALMGKWQQEGVNTSTVMGGLRIAVGKFAQAGRDPAVALQETITEMQNMSSEGDRMALAMEVFGARAGPDMAAAIMEGRFSIEELMSTLEGNTDTIAGVAADTEDWQEKLEKLKNKGLVAIEPIASALFDLMGKGADKLAQLADWVGRNEGKAKALAIVFGSLAAAIVAINVGMKIANGIMMVWRAAVAVATAVQWLWNIAMTANPIGVIIVAIAALIAIIVLIATKTDWFQRLWKVVWTGIKNVISWWWQNVVVRYFNALKWVFDKIVTGVKAVWTGIKTYFGFWKGILDKVIGWVRGVWNNARDNLNRIINFVRDMPDRIRRAASGMWDGIKNAFRNAINWLIGKWNNLSFTVPSISFLGVTVGGFTLDTPNIPYFHQGGVVPGRPSQETLAVLRGGEEVVAHPRNRGGQELRVTVDAGRFSRLVKEAFRFELRNDPTFRSEVHAA